MPTGATALLARAVGAGDYERADRVLRHALWLAAVIGALTTLIGIPLATAAIRLYGVETERGGAGRRLSHLAARRERALRAHAGDQRLAARRGRLAHAARHRRDRERGQRRSQLDPDLRSLRRAGVRRSRRRDGVEPGDGVPARRSDPLGCGAAGVAVAGRSSPCVRIALCSAACSRSAGRPRSKAFSSQLASCGSSGWWPATAPRRSPPTAWARPSSRSPSCLEWGSPPPPAPWSASTSATTTPQAATRSGWRATAGALVCLTILGAVIVTLARPAAALVQPRHGGAGPGGSLHLHPGRRLAADGDRVRDGRLAARCRRHLLPAGESSSRGLFICRLIPATMLALGFHAPLGWVWSALVLDYLARGDARRPAVPRRASGRRSGSGRVARRDGARPCFSGLEQEPRPS